MDTGPLLPAWLLGAPLVLAIMERLMSPRAPVTHGSTSLQRDYRADAVARTDTRLAPETRLR